MKAKSILLTGAVACALTLGVKAEQPAAASGDECVRYEASWEAKDGTLTFSAAPLAPDTLPCQHAWVFRIAR